MIPWLFPWTRARLRWQTGRCGCLHLRVRHQHDRPGSDCGTCGKAVCPRYSEVSRWALVAQVWSLMWAVDSGAHCGRGPAVFDLEDQREELGRPEGWSWLYGKEEA